MTEKNHAIDLDRHLEDTSVDSGVFETPIDLDIDVYTRRSCIVKSSDINILCMKTGGANLIGKLPRDD